jgi:glycosyltransferase involved in cell wall biosynthesis
MSDVMPYRSTRFSTMDADMVERYRDAWRRRVAEAVECLAPDVIHSHHVWLLSALVKDAAPAVPVVTQCHATGFRQMELSPHLATEVWAGCRRNERFVVLHPGHAERLAAVLGVPRERVHVVGAGYRDDLFHARGQSWASPSRLLYVGKYSAAKGLPQLLDAFERVRRTRPELVMEVAGSGGGPEAEALRARMSALEGVTLLGQLTQPELAQAMRRATVCVLPSFYEGVPLVLVEALACGCRLVSTRLEGVESELAPRLGGALEMVDLPPMAGVDTADPAGLPAFVDRLTAALGRALDRGPVGDPATTLPGALEPFTWGAVFRRVEAVWRLAIGQG